MTEPSRRLVLGALVAPLAAPLAAFASTALVYAFTPSLHGAPGQPPVTLGALLVVLFAFYFFGAPVAYAVTALAAVPVLLLLRRAGALRWWSLTAATGLLGQLVMAAYLRWLAGRHGTMTLSPGVGAVSGVAVGFTLWWLAGRERGDRAPFSYIFFVHALFDRRISGK